MNLGSGEKILEIMIASTAYGEIFPGPMRLRHVELLVKKNTAGSIEAELSINSENGTAVYKFSDIVEDSLKKIKSTVSVFAGIANQRAVFRYYDFRDCRDEREMMYRCLLIPEYRAVKSLPKQKLVSLSDVKEVLRCPVCNAAGEPGRNKCPSCGAVKRNEKGRRYTESEGASFLPVPGEGEQDFVVHLCKVHYVNFQQNFLRTHFSYLEAAPDYLEAIFTEVPPVKPTDFHVVLKKPAGIEEITGIFPDQYRIAAPGPRELRLLDELGVPGTGIAEAGSHLIVTFQVWDYTNPDEISSQINFVVMKYNDWLVQPGHVIQ